MTKETRRTVRNHLIEFFLVGFVMGVIEDVIAIKFATNDPITLRTFAVAALVAFPFALISEILVDMKLFRSKKSK